MPPAPAGLLRLLEELRRGGLTVVVISHDFAGLEELCPRTLHLHEGALVPVATASRLDEFRATPPGRAAAAPVPGDTVIHRLWAERNSSPSWRWPCC